MKLFRRRKTNDPGKLFDLMYRSAVDSGIVHTREDFAKILEKPIIDNEINILLKSIENKSIQKGKKDGSENMFFRQFR